MSSRLRAYVRQHHVALLALFVAMSGTAYAAVQLPKNVVKSKHIGPGQVKGSDIAANAVSSQKVADGSLLGADFASGQLPAGLQGAQGATGPQGPTGPEGPLGNAGGDLTGSYPNPLIANGAVTSTKVLNDTAVDGGLSSVDLAAGSVGSQEADGLTGADIANAVSGSDDVNANTLDGADSSFFVRGSNVFTYTMVSNPAGTPNSIDVGPCGSGDLVVAGGFNNGGNEVDQSYPSGNGWHVETAWPTENMTAYVTCLSY